MHKGLNLEYNVKSEYVTFLSFDYSGYWLLTLNDKIDETKLKKSGFYVVNDDEQKFDREFMAKKFGLSKNEIQDYVVYEAEPAIAGTEEICKDCIFQLVMNPKSNLLMVSINKF